MSVKWDNQYAPCYTKHVDYEDYKIGKPLKTPLVKEYKGVHHELLDKRLQIDCGISIAATLPLKKDLLDDDM